MVGAIPTRKKMDKTYRYTKRLQMLPERAVVKLPKGDMKGLPLKSHVDQPPHAIGAIAKMELSWKNVYLALKRNNFKQADCYFHVLHKIYPNTINHQFTVMNIAVLM